MTPTSSRRVRVIVNGRPYLVEVGDLTTSPITVKVNGRTYSVSVGPEGFEAVPSDEPVARGTQVPEEAPRSSGPAVALVSRVRAPMPGNILDIAVKPGDQVQFRQQLCSLEAMKMKSAIRSPRAGTIASVDVMEGQTVAHDDVLFTFE